MKLIPDIQADELDGGNQSKQWMRVIPETNIERYILQEVIQSTIDKWPLFISGNDDKNWEVSCLLYTPFGKDHPEEDGNFSAQIAVTDNSGEVINAFSFLRFSHRMTFRVLADPYDGEYTSAPLHIYWTMTPGPLCDRAQENWDYAPVLSTQFVAAYMEQQTNTKKEANHGAV